MIKSGWWKLQNGKIIQVRDNFDYYDSWRYESGGFYTDYKWFESGLDYWGRAEYNFLSMATGDEVWRYLRDND